MKLDHATIVTKDTEAMRHFFCDVAGLREGPRPAFGVKGSWLYASGQPVVHLIEESVSAPAGPSPSPRIDHVALRVDTSQEWNALLERMTRSSVQFQLARVQPTGELQLFVRLAPNVTIEFVMRPRETTTSRAA